MEEELDTVHLMEMLMSPSLSQIRVQFKVICGSGSFTAGTIQGMIIIDASLNNGSECSILLVVIV